MAVGNTDARVANLEGAGALTLVQRAAQDERPTDAAADIHVTKGLRVLTETAAILGPARRVGVVRDGRGQVELLFEPRFQREVVPARHLVRLDGLPGSRIDRTTKPDANRFDFGTD